MHGRCQTSISLLEVVNFLLRINDRIYAPDADHNMTHSLPAQHVRPQVAPPAGHPAAASCSQACVRVVCMEVLSMLPQQHHWNTDVRLVPYPLRWFTCVRKRPPPSFAHIRLSHLLQFGARRDLPPRVSHGAQGRISERGVGAAYRDARPVMMLGVANNPY
jgi:hypothetical protein